METARISPLLKEEPIPGVRVATFLAALGYEGSSYEAGRTISGRWVSVLMGLLPNSVGPSEGKSRLVDWAASELRQTLWGCRRGWPVLRKPLDVVCGCSQEGLDFEGRSP